MSQPIVTLVTILVGLTAALAIIGMIADAGGALRERRNRPTRPDCPIWCASPHIVEPDVHASALRTATAVDERTVDVQMRRRGTDGPVLITLATAIAPYAEEATEVELDPSEARDLARHLWAAAGEAAEHTARRARRSRRARRGGEGR